MRWLFLLSMLLGCAGAPSRSGELPRGDVVSLRPGDLLVGLEGSALEGHPVLRVRVEGGDHVTAQVLLNLPDPARGLRGSADGRWLAVSSGSPSTVQVHELRGVALDRPVWTSPPGCGSPSFDLSAASLVIACAARGRQPASLLRVSLPGFHALSLVGELGRSAPARGRSGDLFWTQPMDSGWAVIRRSADGVPYQTHSLADRPRTLWPQDDGSVLVEVGLPGGRRGFRRLLPSGVVRDEPLPGRGLRPMTDETPVFAAPDGGWLTARCERGPCALLRVASSGEVTASLNLGGPPTALSQVSADPTARPVEDLATAPASVLAENPASGVGVLGVSLGAALETAFSILDRAGLHPYWMDPLEGRARPRGIGVGWARSGHCIEFQANDRGDISVIELQGCAAPYLSPRLRPLLDGRALADGGVSLVRSYLGPGVGATVGEDAPERPGAPSIRRSELQFQAPDRGYLYEATSEVLGSSRGRLLGGRVRLRLQIPTQKQAVAAP